jgi:hypothetical protein
MAGSEFRDGGWLSPLMGLVIYNGVIAGEFRYGWGVLFVSPGAGVSLRHSGRLFGKMEVWGSEYIHVTA